VTDSARTRMPVAGAALGLVLLSTAFGATPRIVDLGPISGLGALTVAVVVAGLVATLLNYRTRPTHRLVLAPLTLFLVYDIVSMAWTPVSLITIQDTVVWVGFAILIRLGIQLGQVGPSIWVSVRRWMFAGLPITIGIAIAQWASGLESPSTPLVMGVFVSFFAARWSVGARPVAFLLVVSMTLGMLILVARTPAAASLAVIWLAVTTSSWPSRGLKLVLTVLIPFMLVGTVSWTAVAYRPLSAGMTTGDQGVNLGSVALNTSGRAYWWVVVYQSAMESPVLGKGSDVTAAMLDEERWNHPHNDYLRIFHHSGLVGLTLWFLFGWLAAGALVSMYRRERDRRTPPEAGEARRFALYASAFAAIVMITDNLIVYSFFMYPWGLSLGLALGSKGWLEVKTSEQVCPKEAR